MARLAVVAARPKGPRPARTLSAEVVTETAQGPFAVTLAGCQEKGHQGLSETLGSLRVSTEQGLPTPRPGGP